MVRSLVLLGLASLTLAASIKVDPEVVVNRIHPFVSKAFSNLDESKFGVSRMPRKGPHLLFPTDAGRKEVRLVGEEAEQFDVSLYAVGNKTSRFNAETAKATFAGLVSEVSARRARLRERIQDVEIPSVVRKNFAKNATVTFGGKTYVNRLILASEKCVSCHGDTKIGAPLGAALYVFTPAPQK